MIFLTPTDYLLHHDSPALGILSLDYRRDLQLLKQAFDKCGQDMGVVLPPRFSEPAQTLGELWERHVATEGNGDGILWIAFSDDGPWGTSSSRPKNLMVVGDGPLPPHLPACRNSEFVLWLSGVLSDRLVVTETDRRVMELREKNAILSGKLNTTILDGRNIERKATLLERALAVTRMRYGIAFLTLGALLLAFLVSLLVVLLFFPAMAPHLGALHDTLFGVAKDAAKGAAKAR